MHEFKVYRVAHKKQNIQHTC